MFGKGLLEGLKITLVRFFKPKETVQYPEIRLPLPDRFHGKPDFDYDKCIACNQCVVACPNNVIKLETDTVGKKKLLTRYDFDQQYCLFCGLCEEACPKDAIKFVKDFELTQFNRSDIKIKFVRPEQVEKKRKELEQAALEKEAQAKEAQAKKAAEDQEAQKDKTVAPPKAAKSEAEDLKQRETVSGEVR